MVQRMARDPVDGTLADESHGHLADDLAQNVLHTLHKSLSDGATLTRRPSRVDNHQVDVRPLGEGSLRVVHSFDAHFDGASPSPSAPAPLHIEEMGSGEISDGSTPRASAPGRLSLTPQPTARHGSMELLMRQASARPQQQRSRLAHQGSDAGSQTEELAKPGTDVAPQLMQEQLNQPTLANVNNSLFRNMAGGNSRQHAGVHAVDAAAVELQQLQASQWELDPDKILIGERIAVGGCAEVFVGKLEGTVVAIKLLLNVDAGVLERFFQEVSILAALRHPNLLLFMGYARSPALAMVSEYMHRGSLFKVLRKRDGKLLEPKLQRSIATSVARGMAHLHSRSPPILHLDLKSPNILIDSQWRIKIGDFGLSRLLKGGRKFVTANVESGTPEWMAPEVLRTEGGSDKSDVYSYGVVLWEVLTGEAPWENMHPMQVVGAVGFQQKQLLWPDKGSGEQFLVDLAKRCMSPDPRERPSFVEILESLEQQYAPSGPEVTSLSQSMASNPAKARLALPAPLLERLPEATAGAEEELVSVKTKSEPGPLRSDSAEDGQGRGRGVLPAAAAHLPHGRPDQPRSCPPGTGLQRAFEDSAMQLFQGHTSSEMEHISEQPASGQAAAMSEDSHQPANSQQQWLPLRQMSVPPQMLAHSPPSTGAAASSAVAAPADSTRTLPAASQLPGLVASAITSKRPSDTSSGASTLEQPSALRQSSTQGAVDHSAAADAPDADAASSMHGSMHGLVQQSPPSPPQQQVGLTPFEMAAQGSPFSARSFGTASPAVSERSIPQSPAAAWVGAAAPDSAAARPAGVPPAGSRHAGAPPALAAAAAQQADSAAADGRSNVRHLHHDSAPPRPDALQQLEPAADAAAASTAVTSAAVSPSCADAQAPAAAKAVVAMGASAPAQPAESAPPAAPEYKSPFEAAAELQPAFSLAPLVLPPAGQTSDGSIAAAAEPSGEQPQGEAQQPAPEQLAATAAAVAPQAAASREQRDTSSAAAPLGRPGGARLPSASGSGLPPSAAPSAATSRVLSLQSSAGVSGGNISGARSLASLPSGEPSAPASAAASGWSSAQGSAATDADSVASALSKRQLAQRLASLKAAQFERLKAAASHGSESSHSDSQPAGRRSDESRRSSESAGTCGSSHPSLGDRSEPSSPRSPFSAAALKDRIGNLHLRVGSTGKPSSVPERPSSDGSGAWSSGGGGGDHPGASRSGAHPAAAAAGHGSPSAADRLAAAAQTNSTMRSSAEARHGGQVSGLGVICEEGVTSASSLGSLAAAASTRLDETVTTEALLDGARALHMDIA